MTLILNNPVRADRIITRNVGANFYRSQAFGGGAHYWEPPLRGYAHFHRAIDIARTDGDSCGRDLLAGAGGTVIWSGPLNDGNQSVVIHHGDGFATGYGHMRVRTVGRGDHVKRGEKVGEIGNTGRYTTGCHVHYAMKKDFPAGGDVNDFWLDQVGDWIDPWPRLRQNVTVRPNEPNGLNIRSGPGSGSTLAKLYAKIEGGQIVRASDGKVLGNVDVFRRWGGRVDGAVYEINGKTGNNWEKMWLDGAYRFIASPLADRSI